MSGDRGDIVVGWLVRVAVVMALVGVVLFDIVSIGLANVGAQDDANNAAIEASEAYFANRGDAARAWAAALAYAEEHDSKIDPDSFRIDADGRVHLRVTKTANTLFVAKISPLRGLTEITAEGDGRSVPS